MRIFYLFVVSVLVYSCATEKPQGKTEAEVLYKEAQNMVNDERYLMATEKLNHLKNQYPYSFYATPAELLKADILYLQENYTDAAVAYILFKDFHPKHEKISYVIYKIAESYYNQLPDTFDRDLESAVEAIKYYQEIITKYPGSEYVKESKKKISLAQGMLKSKEKYIADFYFKTEKYSAARWRYLEILKDFQDKELLSHSMQRIILSTYHMKEYKKCLDYTDQYKDYLGKNDLSVVNEYSNYCKNKIQ